MKYNYAILNYVMLKNMHNWNTVISCKNFLCFWRMQSSQWKHHLLCSISNIFGFIHVYFKMCRWKASRRTRWRLFIHLDCDVCVPTISYI